MSRTVRRSAVACRAFLLAAGSLVLAGGAFAQESFVNFETGQVRPLALSPDGTRLFAINTPDNRLEIFSVGAGGLTHAASIPVGLEPIAVAALNDAQVWVVNHLSDSVSIVDVAAVPPRVVRTIMTCDEPRDIVFAGPGGTRAFITTARRGQNCAAFANSDLITSGIGRAIVQVYDTNDLGNGLRANVLANVVLFGDTPRALARSTDGNTVYAAAFHSGNQTTALNDGWVCDGGGGVGPCFVSGGRLAPGGLPFPNTNFEGEVGPEVGLIVRFYPDLGQWQDNIGRNWSDVVRFQLPDLDVFAIDAAAALPAQTASFPQVGTVLFNMAVNPVSGALYVSNTEARNEVRFEGPAIFGGPAATTVQGHLHEARITVIDGVDVEPRHLNKHIDYDVRPAPPGVRENSLASPLGMAVTADGSTLYVAAFGSAKVGVFDTAALENDTFVPNAADHIALGGGGPTGLVLDEANGRLYVFTRFDNSISVIDLDTREESQHLPVYNPEPPEIVDGRPFLYDASLTSSNGEASCASCHIFGDFDSLGWDLGNPDDVVLNNPLPQRIPPLSAFEDFHPLKGPMTTQSLRGMADHGSMHWRGDRTGGNDPGVDVMDEDAAFKKFNVAFEGLIGRESVLTEAEMQAFTDFILTVRYPPNPIRSLDQVLTTSQGLGRDLFFGRITDTVFNCAGCHTFDPVAGNFGGDGFTTFEGETQMFKVPHLRNAYQKIGMFGRPADVNAGPQVRGYGYLHDGSIDTIFRFLSASLFSINNAEQRDLEAFMFAFNSNFAPILGQQATITATSTVNVGERADLILARAAVNECDVVARVVMGGEARSALRLADGTFQLDRENDAPLAEPALRALAAIPGQEVTYTCVPRGSGERIALDRDEDAYYDGDEIDYGSDPTDPLDFPGAGAQPIRASTFKLRDDDRAPIDPERSKLSFKSGSYQGAPSGVVVPPFGSAGDPTVTGATLLIHRGDEGQIVELTLPAARWEQTGSAANPGYKYRDPDHADGPITIVTLRAGKLTIRGKGAGLYELDGAPQASMALRLLFGDAVEFCTAVLPKVPNERNDTTAKFVALRNLPAPAACPRFPI